MSHPNEDRLRALYATFANGDLAGFLDRCTDDVTFEARAALPCGMRANIRTIGAARGNIMATIMATQMARKSGAAIPIVSPRAPLPMRAHSQPTSAQPAAARTSSTARMALRSRGRGSS